MSGYFVRNPFFVNVRNTKQKEISFNKKLSSNNYLQDIGAGNDFKESLNSFIKGIYKTLFLFNYYLDGWKIEIYNDGKTVKMVKSF